MLVEMLKGKIKFKQKAENWENAIRIAAIPLLESGVITDSYIDSIVDNVKSNGNYIIILPEVAMPHARPEFGALSEGISFLKLDEPVLFPDNVPVKLFFALSSKSNNGHLEIISELAEILSEPEKVAELMQAKSETDVLAILK